MKKQFLVNDFTGKVIQEVSMNVSLIEVEILPDDCYRLNGFGFSKDQIKSMVDGLLKDNKKISAIKLIRLLVIDTDHLFGLKEAKDFIDNYIKTGIF